MANTNDTSNRLPKSWLIAIAALALAASWWFFNQADQGLRIISAKSIITMDSKQPRVEAVAIEKGKILALGSLASLQQRWPNVEHQHFAEQVLTPGFIENHLHPAMAALLLPFEWITPFEWQLPGKEVSSTQGAELYQKRLQEAAQNSPKDELFITWGYHHYFHGDMSRELLDKLIPDRPALVWHRSFHEVWVNSKALDLVTINEEDLKDQHQVNIEEGHFYESGLMLGLNKFRDHIIKAGRFMDGLEQVVDVVHAGGITTIADMANGMFDLDMEWWAFKWVLDDNDVGFRTRLIPMGDRIGDNPGSAQSIAENDELLKKGNRKLKFVKQIKLLADGAFYSQLMQMRDPGYLDGHHGEWITQPEKLEELASAYWQAGYQLHIHTNGDLGTEVVLDMIERIHHKHPKNDHRTTLHHLGYIGPDQAKRIAELGVVVSANPYYLHTLGETYSKMGLGPERAHYIFRARDLLDAGIKVSLHSDFSMAPAQPLRLAWVAVNREGAGGLQMGNEQAMTVHEAMKAITIDAAFAIRMETEIGSIEVGKSADFTILNQDPYKVAPENLKDIPVWGTIFEGKTFKQ